MFIRLIYTLLILLGSNPVWAENDLIFSDNLEELTTIKDKAPTSAVEPEPVPTRIIGGFSQQPTIEAEDDKPRGPLSATDKIVKRFMSLDADETDGVSLEEYMFMVNQRAEDRFTSMDANGDGEVSRREYRKFWNQRKAKWYRLKN